MGPYYELAEALAERGWGVVAPFLETPVLEALHQEALTFWEEGKLRPARIGQGRQEIRRSQTRGDFLHWWSPEALSPAQERYWQQIDALRVSLNRELFLGLEHFEAHYATYPPGTRYRRHMDRFQDSIERTISCVLYLNQDWSDQEGGQLRLYPEEGETEILPQMGTLMVFRSDVLEHEVLPATRHRFSVAGWLRRRSLTPVPVVHA